MKLEDVLDLEREKNKALESAILEKDEVISVLESKLAEAQKGGTTSVPSTLPTFKIEKSEYRFTVGGFNHEGIDYTADEAVKDKTLCAELVKGKYGTVTKL